MSWSIGKMVLVPALAGGFAGGFAVALLAVVLPKRSCERCDAQLPRMRKPTNKREALRGGYTCTCGAQLDRRGRVLAES
jgi:hypothetical protein